jgi:hypothetical protein
MNFKAFDYLPQGIDRTYRLFISRLSRVNQLLSEPALPSSIAGLVIPQHALAKPYTSWSSPPDPDPREAKKGVTPSVFSPKPDFPQNAPTPKIKSLKAQKAKVYVLGGESIRSKNINEIVKA